jgi:hypothetical protein
MMEKGVSALVMDSPIGEAETLIILSTVERLGGERSPRRAASVQHLPPQLPGRLVEDFKRRAVLCSQPDTSGPAEPGQVRFRIKRA